MGLDMYLMKKTYIGAYYKHRKVTATIEIFLDGKRVNIDPTKISEISERSAYWRKSNQIHKWFVDNIQGGEDNCQESYVEYDSLMKLKALCERVIETKDASELPPASGFFFGSTELDEYYWQDLKETVSMLTDLDPKGAYYYQASW